MSKRLLVLLACMLALSSFAQGRMLSAAQFTEALANALRKAQPSFGVTVKRDLELEVRNDRGTDGTFFLDNAYAQYRLNPETADEVIKTYVASFVETQARTKAAAIDRSRIVPIVKDRTWLAEIKVAMKQRGAKQPVENVYDDYNEELVIVYAEDTPKNINYFPQDALDKLGIPRSELRALAVANLRRLLPKPQVRPGELASIITVGGDYEASLLLFDELWTGLPKVDGEIVVAVPARDLLLYTGSRNQAGVARMRQVAAKYAKESPYRLTPTLFVYRGGRFVRFE